MGFATKLNKFDVEIEDCPMFQKNEFTALREKLKAEMEE
jgi:uncharacterized Fe-S cluster-containing protein